MDDISHEKTTIGNIVHVKFVNINTTVEGKVDTGATTSSIHATDITVKNGQVSFNCPALSNNVITMALDGSQDVHSADGGGQSRPIINFDIEIDGIQIQDAAFNLNDRSNMDAMILVGQNILQAGNFVVDVSQPGNNPNESLDFSSKFSNNVVLAVKTIINKNLSLEDFIGLVNNLRVTSEK